MFPGAGGGVGHMGVQLAKAMGMRVIGVDTGAAKKALCEKLGCEVFIDFAEVDNVAKEVMIATGGKGAHGVFVTAGTAAAYGSASSMVGIGGKVMCIGLRKWRGSCSARCHLSLCADTETTYSTSNRRSCRPPTRRICLQESACDRHHGWESA